MRVFRGNSSLCVGHRRAARGIAARQQQGGQTEYERGLLHPHFDYESAQPWLKERPDAIDADGCVKIPQLPGLGWNFDWDFIEKNRVS